MPDDQLPDAARLKDHGGTVSRLLGAQRPPDFMAGVFVQGDHRRVGAGGQANQFVAVQQRVSREAPHRGLDFVVLFEIPRPHHASRRRVQAEQIAFRSEREDFAPADHGRCARTGRVAYGVGTIVFVPPQDFAIVRVQANNPLGAGDAPALERVRRFVRGLGKLVVEDIDAPLGHGGAGIAGANFSAPHHRRTAGRKRTDNARLAPNAVPLRPKPLRPIVRPEAAPRSPSPVLSNHIPRIKNLLQCCQQSAVPAPRSPASVGAGREFDGCSVGATRRFRATGSTLHQIEALP